MSLYKRPNSRCWWAAITLPGGGRVRRSSGTANRKEAQEWLDRTRAELWRVHRLGERPTHTWQEAVVRWCEEKADKATAHEDRVKFGWLDAHLRGRLLHTFARSATPRAGAAHHRGRRNSGDWQSEGEGGFSPDRQPLSRAGASGVKAGRRTLAMDRQSAGRDALSGSETARALAQQRGGFEALER